jgi:hypothetical protein
MSTFLGFYSTIDLSWWSNHGDSDGLCVWHTWEREVLRDLVQKLEGKDHYLKPICGCDNNIKMDLKMWVGRTWTGLMWLRIKTSGGLLWTRIWIFGFHKMWGIAWLAREPNFSSTLLDGISYQWGRVVRRKHNAGIVELSKRELNP